MWSLVPPKIEYKEKIVTKVQERVRTVTKIKVSPDGTKETTIEEDKNTILTQLSQKEAKQVKKDWIISIYRLTEKGFSSEPSWGIGASRRVLLDAYMGVYATTDETLGLSLSYAF